MYDITIGYNLKYKGVLCTGVRWMYPLSSIFYFIKDGKEYEFVELYDVFCAADTDYIRIVIEWQFLPWLEKLDNIEG